MVEDPWASMYAKPAEPAKPATPAPISVTLAAPEVTPAAPEAKPATPAATVRADTSPSTTNKYTPSGDNYHSVATSNVDIQRLADGGMAGMNTGNASEMMHGNMMDRHNPDNRLPKHAHHKGRGHG